MVQCPVKDLFCFKSDTPYQILSLSRGSFSLFFFGYNSTNPFKYCLDHSKKHWTRELDNGKCRLVCYQLHYFAANALGKGNSPSPGSCSDVYQYPDCYNDLAVPWLCASRAGRLFTLPNAFRLRTVLIF